MIDPTILVLASLADGEKYGYAMMEYIQQFAGVRLGPGTLYGAITRLENHGWIEPVESDDRRQPYRLSSAGRRQPYRLSSAGREYLKDQVASLGKALQTALRRLAHA